MSEMPETPDEPLDPGARARIRRSLLEAADAPSRRRTWLVPLAAAAAVAVVVGGAGVVTAGRGGPPSGSATSTTSSPVSAATSAPASRAPAENVACEREDPTLGGAHEAVAFHDRGGATSFYVTDADRWVLCSVVDSDTVVVTTASQDLMGQGRPGADELEVQHRVLPRDGFPDEQVYVAGGLLPPQNTDERIVYRFSDGHDEPARLRTDAEGWLWWLMTYRASAPFANRDDVPEPVSVTVAVDGQSDTLDLPSRRWSHGSP